MESTNNPIFKRFSLTTVVVPYYGYTHESFVLLSSLSKNTREILNDNYEGFRKYMANFLKIISIHQAIDEKLRLPLDLFKVVTKFSCNQNSCYYYVDSQMLIDLANKIINKVGRYFDNHYMNSQLSFGNMCV